MGCDIHTLVERPHAGSWQIVPGFQPFDWRSYGIFGFLADVRNYSAVPVITPRRGIPQDCSDPERFEDLHSGSWLLVAELAAFAYDTPMEDRRVTRKDPRGWTDHGVTGEPGEGKMTTFREFLGEAFFDEIRELQDIAPDGRVVFGFDS